MKQAAGQLRALAAGLYPYPHVLARSEASGERPMETSQACIAADQQYQLVHLPNLM